MSNSKHFAWEGPIRAELGRTRCPQFGRSRNDSPLSLARKEAAIGAPGITFEILGWKAHAALQVLEARIGMQSIKDRIHFKPNHPAAPILF
jgi:hypothetical protein